MSQFLEKQITYAHMDGLGNIILILDMRYSCLALEEALVQLYKKFSQSYDQVMVLLPIDKRSAEEEGKGCYSRLVIYNQDGSMAAACGNGTRCVIAYLYHKGEISKEQWLSFQVYDQHLKGRYLGRAQGLVEVLLPGPSFGQSAVFWQSDSLLEENPPEEEDIFSYQPLFINLGNPHAVFFSKVKQSKIEIEKWISYHGKRFASDSRFAHGCNITVVQKQNTDSLYARTWERGAGLTKACGTGACAAMIAAQIRGLISDRAVVNLLEGQLEISWSGKMRADISMVGPTNLHDQAPLFP